MRQRRKLSRRRTEGASGRWKRWAAGWLLTLGSVSGVGAFGYYFWEDLQDTERFNVRTVTITGTQALSEETVLEQSGITLEDNVLLLNEAQVASRVERLPYVKSCTVTVTFPDTVNIEVRERRPVASLMVNSKAYELDREHVALREYGANEVPMTPYISNVPGVAFVTLGKPVESEALESALRVWDAFRTYAGDEGMTVSELAAYGEADVRMYCDEVPYELRWGRGDVEKQAKRLVVFWRQTEMGKDCEEYVDLRFGQDLACK